jgi:hypothetical protein
MEIYLQITYNVCKSSLAAIRTLSLCWLRISRVENSLVRRDIEQVEEDVEEFYVRHSSIADVVPKEVMIRGAKVAKDDTIYNNPDAVEGMTAAEEAELRDELQRAIRAADTSPERVYRWRLQAVLSGFQDFTWGLKVVLMTTGAAAVIQ